MEGEEEEGAVGIVLEVGGFAVDEDGLGRFGEVHSAGEGAGSAKAHVG